MTSPYINTRLFTNVVLNPDQMTNDIYVNMKQNLIREIAKKCYKDYGYITDIYQITDYKDGIIEAENFLSSASFDVTFSCRLCMPLIRKQIICQVDRVTKMLITVVNGPIVVIITNERINDKVFFTDNNNVLRYRKDEGSIVLKPKEFVKITVTSRSFDDGDTKIKTIGYLDDMATENEVNEYYKDIYNTDDEHVEYLKYIENDNNAIMELKEVE